MFNKRIGIDLGTANSLVYVEGKGIVLNEPTVVAYSLVDRKIVAVGEEAKEMLGRTPGTIEATHPMKDGVIAEYTVTRVMVRYFLSKALGNFFFKPDIVISISGGATQVERRAVANACTAAGARNVYLIEEPIAAAIGAKISIAEASGNMIINIGGGTTEAAVISLGELVSYESERVAGAKIEEAIVNYLKRKHSLIVGERTVEELKIKYANSYLKEAKTDLVFEVKGRDFRTGLPKALELSERELSESIQKPLRAIAQTAKKVLETIPPELSADIVEKGIILSGGTSTLRNIDKYLTEELDVPCYVAEEPLLCVIRGLGLIAENFELYQKAAGKI
jgi:rod shape-determining protein MreB and related proteins